MELDMNDAAVKAAVEAAAAALNEVSATELNNLKQSIQALEGNNAKLLDEKKAASDDAKHLKEVFDGLGGEAEIAKLRTAQAETEKASALKMLIEGNFDEFQAAITEKAVSGLQKQLGDVTDSRTKAEKERDDMARKYESKLVDIDVRNAALKAGVHPTAVEDIVYRALNHFSVKDDVIGIFNDNGVMKIGSDGKTGYSPAEWLEEQRESSPHWWPGSQGGGAGGSQSGGGGGAANPWSKAGWNSTAQGRVFTEQGREKAEQMAAAAGSRVGATAPS